ncbi:MAG TPA: hypothetical protein VN428_26820 [Bryobacteraceae bacterium]|nr:hypothetical protein [Bryobacteraceae bacterium]
MQEREIEIHDSTIDQITLEGGTAVIHFTGVYIYPVNKHMNGGWRQGAVIRIGNARIEGEFSEQSRAAWGGEYVLADGHFRLNAAVYDNTIPVPLDVHGEVELTMECWGYEVRVFGDSAKLELVGR